MANRTCSVEGCGAPYECKGFCNRHYKRWRLYGDPSAPRHPAAREITPESFWARVDRSAGASGCWPWTGRLSKAGYGAIDWVGHSVVAHRVAYELTVGPVPEGLDLDHLCRNRACANPAHLEPVTSRENTLRSPIALPAINARMVTCKEGHPLVRLPNGRQRWCPICKKNYRRPPRRYRGMHEPPAKTGAPTCKRGHPFAGDNLRFARGQRVCITCQNENQRRRRAAAKNERSQHELSGKRD